MAGNQQTPSLQDSQHATLPEDPQDWTSEMVGNDQHLQRMFIINVPRARQLLNEVHQQARAEEQVQQPAPAPVTAPAPSIQDLITALTNRAQSPPKAPRSVKHPDPDKFDGSPDKLDQWIIQTKIKLEANADHYPNVTAQIRYIYSRFSDIVQQRMVEHFRNYEDPTIQTSIHSAEDLFKLLREQFEDPARRTKATNSLRELRQKNRTFVEYEAEFRLKLSQSEFSQHPDLTVQYMRDGVSEELFNCFSAYPPPRNSLQAFCAYCRLRDAEIQDNRQYKVRSQSRTQGSTSQHSRPSSYKSQSQPQQQWQPRQAQPNVATTVFHGKPLNSFTPPVPMNNASVEKTTTQGGSRMDLDAVSNERTADNRLTEAAKDARRQLRRCLRCNQEGHIAMNCPIGQRPQYQQQLRESRQSPSPPPEGLPSPPTYSQQLKE